MNYFELINKCLVELNYKQVNTFAELTKNDHKKLKNILNIVNSEVCNYDNWNFLLRKTNIFLPAKTGEINNTINGRIAALSIDGKNYKYHSKFEDFFKNNIPACSYGLFNNKLLFPVFDEDKNVEIIYYTKNYAASETGEEKDIMTNDKDTSLIPSPYAEPLLVYGSCLRLKANTQHVKFSYWYSMYKEALANLRSKISVDVHAAPYINLYRY